MLHLPGTLCNKIPLGTDGAQPPHSAAPPAAGQDSREKDLAVRKAGTSVLCPQPVRPSSHLLDVHRQAEAPWHTPGGSRENHSKVKVTLMISYSSQPTLWLSPKNPAALEMVNNTAQAGPGKRRAKQMLQGLL